MSRAGNGKGLNVTLFSFAILRFYRVIDLAKPLIIRTILRPSIHGGRGIS